MDGVAEYDGDRSPDGVAWRYWKRFVKKGYMPDHVDVEIEYALFQLSADLSVFLHWFYSASELVRFATKERLGQNVVLRKIPFTPQVKKALPYIDFEKAKNTNLNTISTRMKRLLPNHHPHELRHTFISRCKEAGVASEVVSIWAGHSLSGTITSTVYTHYSEVFQLKEAEKIVY